MVEWLNTWFFEWARSPGFGGVAALIAATIAYSAARRQASLNRLAQRKEQWWKRAEWALNLSLSDDSDERTVGFRVLESLSTSEWAAEHEGDVIAAATDRPIEQRLNLDHLVSRSGTSENRAQEER